tara:strand:- start:620 stop:1600 length:981 start_codon:yes stop_codon:yes gene_type:complete
VIPISNIREKEKRENSSRLPAVNWHLEAYCNYGCKFCYAPLQEQRKKEKISKDEGFIILQSIADYGVEKINFVGGEPMLNPYIDDWIIAAKKLGLVTSIVSNGTNMTEVWLLRMFPHLDWLGLSIDASNDKIHARIGRGRIGEIRGNKSSHLKRCLEISRLAKKIGYGLKLNTVVCSENISDDMSELVSEMQPDRWKLFKVLPITGENDGLVDSMLITDIQFQNYVNRHRYKLSNQKSIQIVSEDNDEMLGTYAMIDPQGLVYTNLNGRYSYSQRSISEIGFSNAWAQVEDGFSNEGFNERGGLWNWVKNSEQQLNLPIFGGDIFG